MIAEHRGLTDEESYEVSRKFIEKIRPINIEDWRPTMTTKPQDLAELTRKIEVLIAVLTHGDQAMVLDTLVDKIEEDQIAHEEAYDEELVKIDAAACG